MYIITNALKNLGRNKGRNFLIGIILLVIIVATAIAIIINSTASSIIDDYKGRFGSEVSLNLDYDKAINEGNFVDSGENGKGVEEITPKQYFEFGDSKYIKEAQYNASSMINFKDLKPVDDVDDPDLMVRGYLIGSNAKNISDDFKKEARKIIDGAMYRQENECIVSQQFAELNKLKPGDEIEIILGKDRVHKLKISGIFEDNTMVSGGDAAQFMEKNPMLNRNNEILTGLDTIKKLGAENVTAAFSLKNPDDLKAFTAQLQKKGLPSYYKVATDEAGYKAVVGPVENMKKVTTTFMIVVLILGAIILLLISTLAIRERKYEIGVLRAMGMKKGKVGIGFVTEMIALTFACLIIGLSVSAFASQPIADSLLKNQIQIAEEAPTGNTVSHLDFGASAGAPASDDAKPLSELSVHLDFDAAIQIILIAIMLAIVSSIMGIVYITRYEPMKILSERN
ncbi:MAG: ABC transporter permease [Clostridiales Family XIII bacterium]|jgi:putative ABC transport system permease protein|nr:ABC transporter permease [Clostridiales Family XIII bacterium]